MLIVTDEELRAFAARAQSSDVLAIDTEFLRERTYYPQLCLLQLGTDDEQVAVDPFKVKDVDTLRELFCDPSITKVLHACSQDMEILLDVYGVLPRPLFDTQIAATYLGDRSQIGYAALVEEYCGVSLPKTESLTDWSRRPLDDKQLAYAYDDVRYLPAIWRQMRDRLTERGRLSWAACDFQTASEAQTYARDPREAFRKLRHVSGLSARQLAVAREVAAWREQTAQRIDRPRRWVLADELVVEVAKRMPRSVAQVERIRSLSSASRTTQAEIVRAVERGLACPEGELPSPQGHVRPTTDQESVCDLMYAVSRKVAESEDIALSTLCSRDDLMSFLLHRDSSPVAHGWREEVLGLALDDLLVGKLGLTVRNGCVELL